MIVAVKMRASLCQVSAYCRDCLCAGLSESGEGIASSARIMKMLTCLYNAYTNPVVTLVNLSEHLRQPRTGQYRQDCGLLNSLTRFCRQPARSCKSSMPLHMMVSLRASGRSAEGVGAAAHQWCTQGGAVQGCSSGTGTSSLPAVCSTSWLCFLATALACFSS